MNRKSVLSMILIVLLFFYFPLSAYAQENELSSSQDETTLEESSLESKSIEDLKNEEEENLDLTDVVTYEDSSKTEDPILDEESGDNTEVQAQANVTVAIYRLYYPENGEHLYTTDVNEKNTLYNSYGWGYEGIAWYASNSGTPVYRLYHPGLGNHLYTTDKNEVKTLTSKYGWKKDNNGKALFYSSGSVPIYRVYNKKQSGMHHLTTDVNEYNTLPKYGWTREGVKIYAQKIGSPITTTYSLKTNLANAKKAYRTIVNQNKSTIDSFGKTLYQSYYLHDLDSDGIPELLLKLGNCEANYRGVAYTYDTTKQKAVKAGNFYMDHIGLYYGNAARSSGPLRSERAFMDGYTQYKLTLENKVLKQTKVMEKMLKLSELPPNYGLIPIYSTNDLTPLY